MCACIWACQPGRITTDAESRPTAILRTDSWGVSPSGPTLRVSAGSGDRSSRAVSLRRWKILEITDDGAHITESVRAGRVFVDGLGGVEEEVLRDRRHMAEDGLVVAIVGIEQQTGELLTGPDFLSRGFLPSTNGEGFEAAKEAIRATLNELPRESRMDVGVVKEQVRLTLRRYFRRTFGRRPVVLPFVMEM